MTAAVTELVSGVAEDVTSLKADAHTIQEDVGELKSDMKVVKAAVTEQSTELADHERRISALEAA